MHTNAYIRLPTAKAYGVGKSQIKARSGSEENENNKIKINLKWRSACDFLQDPLVEFKPVKEEVYLMCFNRSGWMMRFREVHSKRPSSAGNPHEQFADTKVLAFSSFLQKNSGLQSTALGDQEQFLNQEDGWRKKQEALLFSLSKP